MRANSGLPEVSKLEFTESFFRMQYVSRETNAKVAMKGGLFHVEHKFSPILFSRGAGKDKPPVRLGNPYLRVPLEARIRGDFLRIVVA